MDQGGVNFNRTHHFFYRVLIGVPLHALTILVIDKCDVEKSSKRALTILMLDWHKIC